MCVLVVDPDDDARAALVEALEREGLSVFAFGDAGEALAFLHQLRPCVAVTELSMPVMSGAELVARVRAEPRLATLPLVVYSTTPERAPVGCAALAKPGGLGELVAHVRAQVTHR
jgi:CheY-like chemotaxis protein